MFHCVPNKVLCFASMYKFYVNETLSSGGARGVGEVEFPLVFQRAEEQDSKREVG